MQTIDGSQGEGGGQVVRTSLALSAVTGTPVVVERIRAGRRQPGLRNQHLTSVLALAEVCGASLEGAQLGSRRVVFRPGLPRPGRYHFAVPTAGSASLVLQAVLPPLLVAGGPSHLTLEGGTHNSMAPPYDFLEGVFFPILREMGVEVAARLERPGFYPAGGGRFHVELDPPGELRPIERLDRGAAVTFEACALLARLPDHIGERELKVVQRELGWAEQSLRIVRRDKAPGPGNALLLTLEFEQATEVITAFGRRGLPAETVAARAVAQARTFLRSDVPVGTHLADQMLLPLALAGGGRFRTLSLSSHSLTHLSLIERLLPVRFDVEAGGGDTVVVSVGPRG